MANKGAQLLNNLIISVLINVCTLTQGAAILVHTSRLRHWRKFAESRKNRPLCPQVSYPFSVICTFLHAGPHR